MIEVTDLFKKEVPEFSARNALGAGAMDSARSFIEEFKVFPRNINVRVLASFAPGKSEAAMTAPNPAASPPLLCHSMVKLPETQMKPRRFDSRVGFFTESVHRLFGPQRA